MEGTVTTIVCRVPSLRWSIFRIVASVSVKFCKCNCGDAPGAEDFGSDFGFASLGCFVKGSRLLVPSGYVIRLTTGLLISTCDTLMRPLMMSMRL